MANYRRTQYSVDQSRGVFRVNGICFENGADDSKIEEVISEVSNMDVPVPALMTREALCLYIKAPNSILALMEKMLIGSCFEYEGIKITRWGNLIYNGKNIEVV